MSMTGYGRAQEGHLLIEIQSVNHKAREIVVFLPDAFSFFEFEIKKIVSEYISRGFVKVRVHFTPEGEISLDLLKKEKKYWERIALQLGMKKEEITLSFLLNKVKSEEVPKDLLPTLKKAIGAMLQMRKKEGVALEKDITNRLVSLGKIVASIEKRAPQAIENYRRRVKEKIKSLDDERFLKEALFFLEKGDIDEEIVRLTAHLEHFFNFLKDKGPIGKTLDFLLQEMNREATTIASKAVDNFISSQAIEIRKEVERIKEQVQNIE